MILHVARFADRLFVYHDVDLPSQDTVAVKAAEVFQMPALTFGLGVLIAEYKLKGYKEGRYTFNTTTPVFCSRMLYNAKETHTFGHMKQLHRAFQLVAFIVLFPALFIRASWRSLSKAANAKK